MSFEAGCLLAEDEYDDNDVDAGNNADSNVF
jgi:hypothetical protein